MMLPGYSHGQGQCQLMAARELIPTGFSVLGTNELSILEGRDNQGILFPWC